jgi:hypothetical protein
MIMKILSSYFVTIGFAVGGLCALGLVLFTIARAKKLFQKDESPDTEPDIAADEHCRGCFVRDYLRQRLNREIQFSHRLDNRLNQASRNFYYLCFSVFILLVCFWLMVAKSWRLIDASPAGKPEKTVALLSTSAPITSCEISGVFHSAFHGFPLCVRPIPDDKRNVPAHGSSTPMKFFANKNLENSLPRLPVPLWTWTLTRTIQDMSCCGT